MAYELAGEGGQMYFGIASLENAFKLAYLHGWHPMGTVKCKIEDSSSGPTLAVDNWSSYLSSGFQLVIDEDAANIAAALETAMPDVPFHDCDQKARRQQPLEFFGGIEGRSGLSEFIGFCQAGGFCIA